MRTISEINGLLSTYPEEWRIRWCKNYQGCGCQGGVNCCINAQLASRGVQPITEEEWKLWLEKSLTH